MTDKEPVKKSSSSKNNALKDFKLFCPPEIDVSIKKGDDITELDLPKWAITNLITEGVLKG